MDWTGAERDGGAWPHRRALRTFRLEVLRLHLEQVRLLAPRGRHSKTTLVAAHILKTARISQTLLRFSRPLPTYSPTSAHASPSQTFNHIGTNAKTRRVRRTLRAKDEAAVPVRSAL